MARFLFTVWHYAGHFYPTVAIAKALRERGHECAFYTGPSACRVVADEGFRCFPFQHVDEAMVDSIIKSQQRGSLEWDGLLRFRGTLRQWLIGTLPAQVRDIAGIIADWQPDVIATDPSMFGSSLIIHEAYEVPVAVASFIPACSIPGPDAPPFGLGLP
ncbi:MAG: glycosyltransferase, partial [Ardenticatenaceae bacterium]